MSKHQEWKMIHMLYGYARRTTDNRRVLTESELSRVGVHCDPDSRQLLEDTGVVVRQNDEYELTEPARKLMGTFTIAKGPKDSFDVRVDYPQAFVVMPFGESWSDNVYEQLFDSACQNADFDVVRGDEIVRIGDLSDNLWRQITRSGVVIAEVSVANPNVYYEIGLAHALGKPVFLFKQTNTTLPADFGGAHYYEYDVDDLDGARDRLTNELIAWADHDEHQAYAVRHFVDDPQ